MDDVVDSLHLTVINANMLDRVSNMTGMQAPVSLCSPSWNKTSDVDPTIGEAGVDTTLRTSKDVSELTNRMT